MSLATSHITNGLVPDSPALRSKIFHQRSLEKERRGHQMWPDGETLSGPHSANVYIKYKTTMMHYIDSHDKYS